MNSKHVLSNVSCDSNSKISKFNITDQHFGYRLNLTIMWHYTWDYSWTSIDLFTSYLMKYRRNANNINERFSFVENNLLCKSDDHEKINVSSLPNDFVYFGTWFKSIYAKSFFCVWCCRFGIRFCTADIYSRQFSQPTSLVVTKYQFSNRKYLGQVNNKWMLLKYLQLGKNTILRQRKDT